MLLCLALAFLRAKGETWKCFGRFPALYLPGVTLDGRNLGLPWCWTWFFWCLLGDQTITLPHILQVTLGTRACAGGAMEALDLRWVFLEGANMGEPHSRIDHVEWRVNHIFNCWEGFEDCGLRFRFKMISSWVLLASFRTPEHRLLILLWNGIQISMAWRSRSLLRLKANSYVCIAALPVT